jgi:hypothetical protein
MKGGLAKGGIGGVVLVGVDRRRVGLRRYFDLPVATEGHGRRRQARRLCFVHCSAGASERVRFIPAATRRNMFEARAGHILANVFEI